MTQYERTSSSSDKRTTPLPSSLSHETAAFFKNKTLSSSPHQPWRNDSSLSASPCRPLPPPLHRSEAPTVLASSTSRNPRALTILSIPRPPHAVMPSCIPARCNTPQADPPPSNADQPLLLPLTNPCRATLEPCRKATDCCLPPYPSVVCRRDPDNNRRPFRSLCLAARNQSPLLLQSAISTNPAADHAQATCTGPGPDKPASR